MPFILSFHLCDWLTTVKIHCSSPIHSSNLPDMKIDPKQDSASTSHKTSYLKISRSREMHIVIFWSLWNVTVLPMRLSTFKAMRKFKLPISYLRAFVRSYDKTTYRILKRGPGHWTLYIDLSGGSYLNLVRFVIFSIGNNSHYGKVSVWAKPVKYEVIFHR